MKTPYLDLYIEVLEKDKELGLNSFYQNCKLRELIEIKKQLTLTDVVASKPKSKDALNKAVSAIYFNDNSDYLKALYGIVNDLTDFKQPIDIRSLYKSLNPD